MTGRETEASWLLCHLSSPLPLLSWRTLIIDREGQSKLYMMKCSNQAHFKILCYVSCSAVAVVITAAATFFFVYLPCARACSEGISQALKKD